MAAGNFQNCHAVTAKWEGGWSDHPSDPGGKTMYGITEKVFHAWLRKRNLPTRPVRNITRVDALEIYRAEYWVPAKGETLARGVDLAVYDACVNSGVSRGRKWLLASVGGSAVDTVKRICAKRLGFMQSLAIWKSFGKGWSRRVADIEAKGVAWALAATGPKGSVQPTLNAEAKKAENRAKTQTKTGVGAGAGGVVAAPEAADQLAGLAMFGLLTAVAVVIGVLIWRSKINKDRAKAYAREAAK